MYKQSFFYLHRLVGSCAPLLHRRGRSQAERRWENPDHPRPPKTRIFRLCQPETLRIWGATTAGSPRPSPSPPGSPRIRARDTTKPPEGRPSETENPSRRCASSSSATPAADADAAGERSNPRPAASGAESRPGTGGIDGSEARIWKLGFRAPAGLRGLLASSIEGRERRGVETDGESGRILDEAMGPKGGRT